MPCYSSGAEIKYERNWYGAATRIAELPVCGNLLVAA